MNIILGIVGFLGGRDGLVKLVGGTQGLLVLALGAVLGGAVVRLVWFPYAVEVEIAEERAALASAAAEAAGNSAIEARQIERETANETDDSLRCILDPGSCGVQ